MGGHVGQRCWGLHGCAWGRAGGGRHALQHAALKPNAVPLRLAPCSAGITLTLMPPLRRCACAQSRSWWGPWGRTSGTTCRAGSASPPWRQASRVAAEAALCWAGRGWQCLGGKDCLLHSMARLPRVCAPQHQNAAAGKRASAAASCLPTCCLPAAPSHCCCAVTRELSKAGMLPAIWFIFSRRDCDLAARQLELHGVQLTSAEGEWVGGAGHIGGGGPRTSGTRCIGRLQQVPDGRPSLRRGLRIGAPAPALL